MNVYPLPLRKECVQEFHVDKSPVHTGNLKYSVDFICNEGSEIFAVDSGEVVWLKNDSDQGGFDRKYYYLGNRIVLKHKNGKYSAYEHLRYKGAIVKMNQKVKKHELIGYSGNTGYSHRPHLHFEIFINPSKDESEGETIPVNFKF